MIGHRRARHAVGEPRPADCTARPGRCALRTGGMLAQSAGRPRVLSLLERCCAGSDPTGTADALHDPRGSPATQNPFDGIARSPFSSSSMSGISRPVLRQQGQLRTASLNDWLRDHSPEIRGTSSDHAPSGPPRQLAVVVSYSYAISICKRQWSLGPHCSGELSARTVMESAKPAEANAKSNWRVAVAGVWRVVWWVGTFWLSFGSSSGHGTARRPLGC